MAGGRPMNWKELVETERDVRLNVIADDADIIQEFANSLGFINVKGVAAFEVTCICFNDEVKKDIFPATLQDAPKKIRSYAGYSSAKKTKVLRANIYTLDDSMEVVLIVRESLFKG